MGDKATIGFLNADGEEIARVYIHNQGSKADEVLNDFFANELDLIRDRNHHERFTDPCYLAAHFVMWVSRPDGGGVGVVNPDIVIARRHWTVTSPAHWSPTEPEMPSVVQVYPEPIETINDFGFGIRGGSGDDAVIAPMLPVGPMNRAKALRAAAWLSLIADPQGDDFAAVLDAIKST